MKKILLNGVDGNFGGKAAEVLLAKYPHEDLVFAAPTEKGLKKYADMGIETRIADFNDKAKLADAFAGVDTVVLISMPFVGPRRREAHKTAVDAAVAAKVNRLVYTSIVGAGEKDIDTYEVNDHVWTEAYIKEQPIHYLFLRDSQYAEAMVSNFVNAVENTNGILANNMGDGKMAYISRDDCALAAASAAMSDWQDRVVDVNGAELLTIAEYLQIASEVTGKKVEYKYISDEEQYAFFDSIGVPRTTEEMWASTAKNFPFCSDGMVTFGRAIRNGQMDVHTDDFEKLTGQKPITVREIFEYMDEHLIGNRTSTDN
jgi:NAD(P)H dehydrogenase (quinone)